MNNKGANQTACTHRLICAFLFAYCVNRSSHDVTHISLVFVIEGVSILIEPEHIKTNKMTCTSREDSDQPGHLPSLISLRCAASAQSHQSLRCAASAQSDQSLLCGVRPVWSDSSLFGIRPVWSESSLCALREGRDLSFRLTEKTDQTAQSETLLGAKVILLVLSCGSCYFQILLYWVFWPFAMFNRVWSGFTGVCLIEWQA